MKMLPYSSTQASTLKLCIQSLSMDQLLNGFSSLCFLLSFTGLVNSSSAYIGVEGGCGGDPPSGRQKICQY